MAREGVPINVIQRQLGPQPNLGSIDPRALDIAE